MLNCRFSFGDEKKEHRVEQNPKPCVCVCVCVCAGMRKGAEAEGWADRPQFLNTLFTSSCVCMCLGLRELRGQRRLWTPKELQTPLYPFQWGEFEAEARQKRCRRYSIIVLFVTPVDTTMNTSRPPHICITSHHINAQASPLHTHTRSVLDVTL